MNMDELPRDSSEHESLEPVVSESSALHPQDPFFQGNLGLQVQQEGYTNLVSWNTSAYNSYPYVTLTRQDTEDSSDFTTLLNRSYKYSSPYYDDINNVANPGDRYAYTVALSAGTGLAARVGIQQTVDVWISPPAPIRLPEPIFPEELSPIGEKSPVERIHESPAVDIPSVASEEHLQE